MVSFIEVLRCERDAGRDTRTESAAVGRSATAVSMLTAALEDVGGRVGLPA